MVANSVSLDGRAHLNFVEDLTDLTFGEFH
jgi:hypothetical protein